MVTVSAETSVSSSLDETWTALGRRNTYFYFPGVTPATTKGGPLTHALDLPIVDRQEQAATLEREKQGLEGQLAERNDRLSSLHGLLGELSERLRKGADLAQG